MKFKKTVSLVKETQIKATLKYNFYLLHLFPVAVIMTTWELKIVGVFSHSSGDLKSEIKVLTGPHSPLEASRQICVFHLPSSIFQGLPASIPGLVAPSLQPLFPSSDCLVCMSVSKLPLPLSYENTCDCIQGPP